jgi:rhamnosyltransferase
MQKISVVIPVKNGSATLDRCLGSIKLQKGVIIEQILVIDSASTDHSLEIAKQHSVNIVNIESNEFNHGATRNLGVKSTTSELVYFTVQDAYLPDERMLEKMASYFINTRIAAISGIQGVPISSETNPYLWFKRATEPKPIFVYKNESESKTRFLRWDNVNSMYRVEVLLEIPFKNTYICEDILWANEAYARGNTLVYDPSLLVYHYHHKNFVDTIKTEYLVDCVLFFNYGKLPKWKGYFSQLIYAIVRIFKVHKLPFTQKCKWALHNFLILTASFSSFLLFYVSLLIGSKIFMTKLSQKLSYSLPIGKTKTSIG